MKKILLGVLMALALMPFVVDASVYVRGYTRKDGTYVQPHYRSNPDGNPYNNWSYPGNTNPYTGETATGDPNTYLNNYYGGSSASSLPSYTVPSATPLPSATPWIYPYSGATVQRPHKTIPVALKNWIDSNPDGMCMSAPFSETMFQDCYAYKYLKDNYTFDVEYPLTVESSKNLIIEQLKSQILALQAQIAALMEQQSNKK